jgi:homoaconitase/3-isopropylmalate dehydratase large subunit
VYEDAIKRGYVEIYLESGAVFTNATCGACVGTHLGALGKMKFAYHHREGTLLEEHQKYI